MPSLAVQPQHATRPPAFAISAPVTRAHAAVAATAGAHVGGPVAETSATAGCRRVGGGASASHSASKRASVEEMAGYTARVWRWHQGGRRPQRRHHERRQGARRAVSRRLDAAWRRGDSPVRVRRRRCLFATPSTLWCPFRCCRSRWDSPPASSCPCWRGGAGRMRSWRRAAQLGRVPGRTCGPTPPLVGPARTAQPTACSDAMLRRTPALLASAIRDVVARPCGRRR